MDHEKEVLFFLKQLAYVVRDNTRNWGDMDDAEIERIIGIYAAKLDLREEKRSRPGHGNAQAVEWHPDDVAPA